MRTPFVLLAAALMLIVTRSGAAAAPTDAVTVVPAPEGQGNIFSPGIRLVADLEQSYVEEEFFVSGEANLYTYNETPVPGEIIVHPNMCTLFTCGPAGAVPYTTRVIVRRPTDVLDFNGTVIIEWWNSTAGFDTAPAWDPSAEYFARKGIAYVGVTNSTTSIGFLTGGCRLFGIFPPACGTRYAALTMPENGLAYEMVSQIANLLKNDATANNPLLGYSVDRIFHVGQSQQGGSMVTYATAFHFSENDGYFVQAAGSARSINSQCACEAERCGCQEPDVCPPPAYPACTPTLQDADRRVATDLPVPVYRAQTESDMRGVLSGDSRQTDTAGFRYYEMAGTAHNTLHKGTEVIPSASDPFFLEESCALPSNTLADGPIFGSYLYNAMWENMEQQVESATAPPSGDLMIATECSGGSNDGTPCSDDGECDSGDCADVIECIGGTDDGTPCSDDGECESGDCSHRPARDANGNSVGGIRLPQMDLPTATYSFPNPPAPNLPISLLGLVCRLSGAVEPFDDAKLAALYPDWAVFVDQFNQKIDDLIAARFLLPEDGDKLRLFVEQSSQQKCVNGLNKNFGRVAKAQGKDICGCIKDQSAGKLDLEGLTAEECTTADRQQKVDKAKQKTISKAAFDCGIPAPDFGATDAATVNQAAMGKGIDLIHDVFGSDLDAAVVASGSAEAECQSEVAKGAKKCQDAKLKEFGKCKKAGLKDASVHDVLTLAACMGKDPKGKIDKACVVKLNHKVDGKCAGLDYATLFPGECAAAATLADFEACVERRVECRACLALNDADVLDRNCDQLDDAKLNASCP